MSAPPAPSSRLAGLDLLKLCLALLVVTIHANPFKGVSVEATGLLGNGLARVAVPGFFVVAGFLFRPEVPGRSARMVWRYLELHLIWLTLYTPLWWKLLQVDNPLWAYAKLWIFGWWHLWFLTGLAMAIAAASLVWRWRNGPLLALALALFALGYGLQSAHLLQLIPKGIWPAEVRNGLLVGLPFFLFGHLLRRSGLPARLGFGPALGLGLAGLVLAVGESWGLRLLAHPDHPLAPETLIAAVLACPALVAAAVTAPALPRWLARWPLGTAATGVYFVHVAFVIVLSRAFTLPRAEVYLLSVLGALVVTAVLIRTRLDKRLF